MDTRKENDFICLKNQGATCYMNSLMETLYLTPYFRNVVYHMPRTKNNIPYESGYLELQNLLYLFQCSDSSAATKALVKSFGLDVYPFLKDNVQGLNSFLFGKLENKGAAVKGTVGQHFEGHCIECIHADYKSSGIEPFNVEHQEGDYKYHAENLCLQRGQLWEVSNKTHNAEGKLFSESELGLDLLPHPPEKSKEDILFFILCNPKEEEVCFVGRIFINASGKPSDILRKLNEMTGLMPYEEIKLHETSVKFTFGPKLQLCEYFVRSNSSSKGPIFAPVKACIISLIMSLQSPAMRLRNICSLVFSILPKVPTHPGFLNDFQKDEQVEQQLMELTGNLPELPREILMDIFTLLEIPDLVRAGSVCSSWNSAYANMCSIGQYKMQQTPCLLYTSESAGEKVAHIYSLAEKRAYKLILPEPPIQKRYLIGSSHGWLVTVDERSEMHLVNPITSEQIALPSVITIEQVTPIYDDTGAICNYLFSSHATQPVTRRPLTVALGKLRCYLHHKALVFYDMSAGSYIVVLIYNPYGQLSFARIGDEKWTRLPSHTHFQDCIYKNGVLYAVTSFGEIIAIDLSGTVLSTKTILDRVRNRYGSHRVYIAEAPWGDLLQIWRPEVWIEEVDEHRHRATFRNKAERMEIYKVCTVAKKLVQIDSLDGYVLFLGNNQTLCSRAEVYPQLKPNHVYFTDDVEGVAYSCEQGYRLNIGVLNFGNKIMEEIIFPRPWSNCLAPLLIMPNPRKMDSSLHI
ncbi:unnamed protein product [Urochloa decumbens]|uniref:F-box domain-containing protein n=1 Tax=Urochloa decumbens TaxID=240449 RepID=A0ABC8X665_9POAL